MSNKFAQLPVEPTEAMLAALDAETPYFLRRAADKSHYEIGVMCNADWRECVSNEQEILSRHVSYEVALPVLLKLVRAWRHAELLRVAHEVI